ncbi:hypothetical protein FKM82_006108 [Ascaphus truei]
MTLVPTVGPGHDGCGGKPHQVEDRGHKQGGSLRWQSRKAGRHGGSQNGCPDRGPSQILLIHAGDNDVAALRLIYLIDPIRLDLVLIFARRPAVEVVLSDSLQTGMDRHEGTASGRQSA